MKKRRIEWIDMARGYGTLLVILGHLDVGVIGKWIYSFHMPFFFFLSGLLFKRYSSAKQFFIRKCKTILVPYFCLGIPVLLLHMFSQYRDHELSRAYVLELISDFLLQKRYMAFWFLTCLFGLNMIFYLLMKITDNESKLITISVISSVLGEVYYLSGGCPLIWNLDVCLMALPFFCVGYCYGQHKEKIDKDIKKHQYWILALSIVINILCQSISFGICGFGLEMYRSNYGIFPLIYISAFAGICFMMVISKMYTINFIKYIGENSMLYFAWHGVIIEYLMPRLSGSLLCFNLQGNIFIAVLDKMIQLILIVFIITICNYVISSTRFKFILGK